jgi:hypothetical protein
LKESEKVLPQKNLNEKLILSSVTPRYLGTFLEIFIPIEEIFELSNGTLTSVQAQPILCSDALAIELPGTI